MKRKILIDTRVKNENFSKENALLGLLKVHLIVGAVIMAVSMIGLPIGIISSLSNTLALILRS